MTYYLCTVPNQAKENYGIGIHAHLWGVQDRYKAKIGRVKEGDTLVLVVGGVFRSIHKIEGAPFIDNTPLWPANKKDGSLYPHRVEISEALFTGNLPIKDLADQISFMRGKTWGGTIQGPNGVFNNRLTESDMLLIQERLEGRESKPPVSKDRVQKPLPSQATGLKFYEREVEDRIVQLLPKMGLELFQDQSKDGRQFPIEGGRIDLLCRDKDRGNFVVIELKKGEAPNQTMLQILRYMSWVRQNMAQGKNVRGVILTEAADSALVEIVKEVPNVDIQYYRLSVELVQ